MEVHCPCRQEVRIGGNGWSDTHLFKKERGSPRLFSWFAGEGAFLARGSSHILAISRTVAGRTKCYERNNPITERELEDRYKGKFILCMATADYTTDKNLFEKITGRGGKTEIERGIKTYDISEFESQANQFCKDLGDESKYYVWDNSMACEPTPNGETPTYLNIPGKGPLALISSGPEGTIEFSFIDFERKDFSTNKINMTYALAR